MHRHKLLDLIAPYERQHPDERRCVERFRQFITANVACFERSCAGGHVTGSAWMVNRAGTHTLLTHHRKLQRWLQLGGHADGHANILEVALREAREESGIIELAPVSPMIFDLDIHRIPARNGEPEHAHYDVRFAIQTVTTDQYVVSDESHALRWVPIEHLSDFTHDVAMLRMQRKWYESGFSRAGTPARENPFLTKR
ncbi:MAG: NUDIX hydrolase [Anaerolineae bacterium]|nr:NUDIX hydrolase [Anaerolineae bacterium]